MKYDTIAIKHEGKNVYLLASGHFGSCKEGRLECFARHAIRGSRARPYLKLYNDKGRGRMPVTLFWIPVTTKINSKDWV